ncbi:MAG: hypothetical protein KY451_04030 [Actinobacteria bacterium]|nr:hypothetical protein [Actinomycetota bacterium]
MTDVVGVAGPNGLLAANLLADTGGAWLFVEAVYPTGDGSRTYRRLRVKAQDLHCGQPDTRC